ncbi:uncharacterized protein LDX57_003959 [Aspergillus melleus]|uniref:uncharacterized protein n=1 Tax=Aspergillus melleus TaxID=138277 RepID=UPI001E8EA72F|nr:uncharacterized protein LDX57_003959 [Aspergillus melleus]KAH8426212.1 hypothetical protein LDX57_003959 [Aspergillus melleus]
MKLRSTIRPPKRLYSEEYVSTYSEVNLRRTPKSIERPPIIEFNPNLPSAAFPTLDNSRSPESNADSFDSCEDISEEEMDFEDFTFTEIENLKASNGPLNPIYVRNMELMANAGCSPSHMDYLDMQDSDGDEIDDGLDGGPSVVSNSTGVSLGPDNGLQIGASSLLTKPQSVPEFPEPQWCDLPVSLRVEIVSNLLQSNPWSRACIMLGLSVRDQVDLREAWSERDKQLDYEDEQLEKMQEERLRALMRIDNSLPNRDRDWHSIWALFGKTRRQARRDIQEQQRESDGNFFMCNSDEIAVAKRFLRQRGLSVKLVGEWCNTIPVVEGPDGDESGPGNSKPTTLKWNLKPTGIDISGLKPGTFPARNNATASNKATVPTASKVSLINDINGFGASTSARPVDRTRHRSGVVNTVTSWINAPSQRSAQSPRPNGLVSQDIGMQRAAQIESTAEPQAVDPTRLARQTPPEDRIFQGPIPPVEGAADTHEVPSCPVHAPRQRTPPTGPEEPVRRAMGGCWSYLSAGPNQNLANTATRPRRRRLEGTTSGLRNEITRTDHGSNEQRPPVPQTDARTEIHPIAQPEQGSVPEFQPTATRNLRSPSIIDLDGFHPATTHRGLLPCNDGQMSRTVSPAPVEEDAREETDSMTITPPTSDVPLTHASQDSEGEELTNDDHWEGSEDEDDMELDEMVLVPCSSS